MNKRILMTLILTGLAYIALTQNYYLGRMSLLRLELNNFDLSQKSTYPPYFQLKCYYVSPKGSIEFEKNGRGGEYSQFNGEIQFSKIFFKQEKDKQISFSRGLKKKVLRPLALNEDGLIKNFLLEGQIYKYFCFEAKNES